jgi:tRNA nucleotidyltransferase/poly(A) polymerase
MAGKPLDIYEKISKDDLSHFMTEKFGTITLIKDDLKYELTPLRTESDYEDNRHPGEIVRSNNLLLDSERRDFTINCIYYTNYTYSPQL